MPIPVFKPSIRRRDMHSVLECLVTDVIGPASIAEELVDTIVKTYMFSGGAALREYVRAIEVVFGTLDLKRGDKIMISSLAPGAYGNAIKRSGLSPVLVDVIEDNACPDPDSARKALKENIRAMVIHAPLGRVPDMNFFYETGIPVVIDIGEALGAKEIDGFLGQEAAIVVLPMETDGIATTGGGTIIMAKEKACYLKMRSELNDLNPDAFLPDLNASLGIVQWRDYHKALDERRTIYEAYMQSLMKGNHRTFNSPEDELYQPVPYSFPVVVKSPMNEVRRYAGKKGVEVLPAFSGRLLEKIPTADQLCPKARSLTLSTVLFPLYPTLGKKNVQLIMKVLSTLP